MGTSPEYGNLYTGSHPGATAQHDPDVCPRCGERRSQIMQRVLEGEIVPVNCDECWNEIVRRIHKYQEMKKK